MIRLVFFCWLSLLAVSAKADCVILLHGLARSADSMQKMANSLEKDGYQAVNIDYPSQTKNIETLANEAIPQGLNACGKNQRINFVTHSMGGILVRQYLSQHKIDSLHRVVMLGPPNQGSEIVDKLGDWRLFKWLNGPAGQQLGTDANSTPSKLGKVNFELGVIAGSSSINLILSAIIPGDDDGKVSIENSKIEGMNDHLVMSVTHPMMMKNCKVIQQTAHFLEFGKFKK